LRYRVWLRSDGWYQVDEESIPNTFFFKPKPQWFKQNSCHTLEEAEKWIERQLSRYEAARVFKTRYYPA
jgi:hypothetical protein